MLDHITSDMKFLCSLESQTISLTTRILSLILLPFSCIHAGSTTVHCCQSFLLVRSPVGIAFYLHLHKWDHPTVLPFIFMCVRLPAKIAIYLQYIVYISQIITWCLFNLFICSLSNYCGSKFVCVHPVVCTGSIQCSLSQYNIHYYR
jgi:hypothetical protein